MCKCQGINISSFGEREEIKLQRLLPNKILSPMCITVWTAEAKWPVPSRTITLGEGQCQLTNILFGCINRV